LEEAIRRQHSEQETLNPTKPLPLICLLALSLIGGKAYCVTLANDLTSEEQALVDKGATMEMYQPEEHSRHFIASIDAAQHDGKVHKTENVEPLLCFVFGMEDAAPARAEGKSMAESHYTRAQAEQFLLLEGWDKYHDRFFTRCYVQEGQEAYDTLLRKR
jgi:hypothetical protein